MPLPHSSWPPYLAPAGQGQTNTLVGTLKGSSSFERVPTQSLGNTHVYRSAGMRGIFKFKSWAYSTKGQGQAGWSYTGSWYS